MAKDKALSANPAQAYNKHLKKKQLNKHKAEKTKARDAQLLKRRPGQIISQMDELRNSGPNAKLSADNQRLLESLEHDLSRIRKLQSRGGHATIIESEANSRQGIQNSQKVRKLRDPERSFYYDEICEQFRFVSITFTNIP
jgi:NADH dehydrogenase/NADH:ubiquinone oxidoreductase subunit G